MSRFLNSKMREMNAYTPGEQPVGKSYIKLNTNECPYPPSPAVIKALETRDNSDLRLYPSPTMSSVKGEMAKFYALNEDQVFVAGGSDEALAFAFMAFFEPNSRVLYPNITYGFYKVYADLLSLNSQQIALTKNLEITPKDYYNAPGGVVIANPNAPTGIALSRQEIEGILKNNPNNIVIIDEAYVDFADDRSVVGLIKDYDNLLVVQTFSKSRALAGMRLGFAFGNSQIIAGLEKVKFSFNPYNIDRVSEIAAIESIKDITYLKQTVGKINDTKKATEEKLKDLGFSLTHSETNFLFIKHLQLTGEDIYEKLKDDGVLVRYFPGEITKDYVRITVGTNDEMKKLTRLLASYLEG